MGEINANPTHVLIVEDNRADVRVLRMALAVEKDWPLTIDVADDGEKAIAYLRRQAPYQGVERPDLVILDLNLPKFDGTEVLRVIRAAESLRALPVIVLSSAPVEILQDKLQHAGVTARCITKPFEFKNWMVLGKEIRRCFTESDPDRVRAASS
jgi:chemotaxis family two-component system response regulator Rcp1